METRINNVKALIWWNALLWYIFLGVCLNKMYCAFSFSNWLIFGSKSSRIQQKCIFLSSLVYLYYFYSFRLYKHFSQAIYRYGKRCQSCILADAKSPGLKYSVSAAFCVFSCLNATLAVFFEASLFVLLFCVK